MLVSVPLLLEYEAVLSRDGQLAATGLTLERLSEFLDYLVLLAEPVRLHYLWRPQLNDVADEMVLEAAINGQADCIVTFNTRDFTAARRFGIEVVTPAEARRRLR